MSTFTLTISCLTTSNLPWFMDLTFQVPMQYCSLQHRTLLLSPVISTTGCCFCFSIRSIFLDFFLHWSPLPYWAPTNLESSSFSVLSFYLFMRFMGSSRQEHWSVLHSLLQWTTFCQTSPPRPDRLGWPHMAWLRLIVLDKAAFHVIKLASFLWLWFQSACPDALSSATMLLGFPLPWTWVSLHGGFSKVQPLLLALLPAGPLLHSSSDVFSTITLSLMYKIKNVIALTK